MSKNDAGRTRRISSRNIREGQWYKMHFFNCDGKRVEVKTKVLKVCPSSTVVYWCTMNNEWLAHVISSTVWDTYTWEAMTPEEVMIVLLEH